MSKRKKIENEEYEFSVCAEDAIQLYWPSNLKPGHYLFERSMVELQIKLIKCHMNIMYPSDKRRAKETINFLKDKLREITNFG